MRSLVVDDSPTIRILLQHLLGAYGTCDVAENGQEAIDAHRRALADGRPYELVCLDLALPYYDGIAVLSKMRSAESQGSPPMRSRILVITASREPERTEKAKRIGADGCLLKPIVTSDLMEYLQEFGFVEAPSSPTAYDDLLDKLQRLCDSDEIPVSSLAEAIRKMALSIERQSATQEPDSH
jgi:two-component system chemotaxis response regulator CheY